MVSITFALVCVLALVVVGRTTGKRIPFEPSLLNTKYEAVIGTCGFMRADSAKVTIEESHRKYVPTIINDSRHGYDGSILCSGYVELYYRQCPKHLWIRSLKETYSDFPPGGSPAACSTLQTVRYISPWGPSGDEFIVEFKKMYAGVKKINAATPDCVKSGGKPDPVLSYLYMVAYEYFITLT